MSSEGEPAEVEPARRCFDCQLSHLIPMPALCFEYKHISQQIFHPHSARSRLLRVCTLNTSIMEAASNINNRGRGEQPWPDFWVLSLLQEASLG